MGGAEYVDVAGAELISCWSSKNDEPDAHNGDTTGYCMILT